jgi:hypothetical protein
VIEEAQVVVHKADQPDLLADFRDADVLSGEHGTQVDFPTTDADAAATAPPATSPIVGIIDTCSYQNPLNRLIYCTIRIVARLLLT